MEWVLPVPEGPMRRMLTPGRVGLAGTAIAAVAWSVIGVVRVIVIVVRIGVVKPGFQALLCVVVAAVC